MENLPIKVLFVNHLQHNCGVYQFFKRMVAPLVNNVDRFYIETNQEWEHDYWINILNPDIVVYNFYFSGVTMPWLSTGKIRTQKGRFKQIGIHHEGEMFDKGFDLILHQDPTNTDTRYYNLPRPIPEFHSIRKDFNPIVTLGSFGFGLGGKGFTRVVQTAIDSFDRAVVKLNIPFAHFGDAQGNGARAWADACRLLVKDKSNIQLIVTHELLPENALLEFLDSNDINCFLYDQNGGRGLSGTTDYAIAVGKPLLITRSDQFRHLWSEEPRILIEENSIIDILYHGAEYTQKFRDKWNTQKLIDGFEQAFQLVMKG